MNVRGNPYELNNLTGQISTKGEYYRFFELGSGFYDTVYDYIVNGRTLIDIKKSLRDDEIIFEYSEYGVEGYNGEHCERHRTDVFLGIETADEGWYPSDGAPENEDIWYVAKDNEGTATVLNIDNGDVLPMYDFRGRDSFLMKWYPNNESKERTYFLEYTKEEKFGDTWSDIRISAYNTDSDGIRSMAIPTSIFEPGVEYLLRMSALNSSGDLDHKTNIGRVTFVENTPPGSPNHISPRGYGVIDSAKNGATLRWKYLNENPESTQSKAVITVEFGSSSVTKKTYTVYGEREFFTIPNKDIPSNSPSNPLEVNWRVQVFDEYGVESPYSRLAETFYIADGIKEFDYKLPPKNSFTPYEGTFEVTVPSGMGEFRVRYLIVDNEGEVVLSNGATLKEGKNTLRVIENDEWNDFLTFPKQGETYELVIQSIKSTEHDYFLPSKVYKVKFEYFRDDLRGRITAKEDGINDGVRITLSTDVNLTENNVQARLVRRDFPDERWKFVSEPTTRKTFFDNQYSQRGSHYAVMLFDRKGNYDITNEVHIVRRIHHPHILDIDTGENIRIKDVVDTKVDFDSPKGYFTIAGRNKTVAEFSAFNKGKLTLQWEVYELSDYTQYLRKLQPNKLYLYRDKEGRYHHIAIDKLDVRELYNPLEWEFSITATIVEGFPEEGYVDDMIRALFATTGITKKQALESSWFNLGGR